jgi:hypothetical protein
MTLEGFVVSRNDKDMGFKLIGKRLAWSQAFVPLINVPVRIPNMNPRKPGVDITDADVLGARISADGAVDWFLADCRNTTGNAVERVFWVKGLASYLSAKRVYLLKRRISENAVWMAKRLEIVAADEKATAILSKELLLDELRGPYFDGSGYAALDTLYRSASKGSIYFSTRVFLESTVWSLSPSERVQSLLELVRAEKAYKTFRPQEPLHQSLVLFGAFQLALALGLLIAPMDPTSLSDFELRFREVLHGGAESLYQKTKLAEFIAKANRNFANDAANPLDLPSFPALIEVARRLLVKRYALNDAIRYLDVLRHYHAAQQAIPESSKYLRSPLARKFAHDLLDLFILANNLDPKFSNLATSTSAIAAENTDVVPEDDSFVSSDRKGM